MRKILSVLVLCLTLNGCIIVEDFSSIWDKGSSDSCIDKVVAEEYKNSFENAKLPFPARHIKVDGAYFLMLKEQEKDKGGHLYRFVMQDNIFVGFRPDPAAYELFTKSFSSPLIHVTRDEASIAILDDASFSLLKDISNKPQFWKIDVKRMYNPAGKKECSLFIPTEDEAAQ